MRTLLICILAIAYIVIPGGWTLTLHPVIQAIVYPLVHGKILHLAINCYSIYLLLSPGHKDGWRLPAAYIISCLVYGLSSTPVLGISNFLFALLGLRTPSLSNKWWTDFGTILFFIVTAITLLLPNISAITHIVSFISGVIIAIFVRNINKLKRDIDAVG